MIFKAAEIHRANHNPNAVQISTLLSIKTGSCPENCKYCPQSAHYNTGLEKESLMALDKILEAANAAKEAGASRFCMGAALVKVAGTPMETIEELDQFEFIRTIAVSRIMMSQSVVRLSAGRENMNEQTQALCFLAGANSIFYGEKLLTTSNPEMEKDRDLFAKLGIAGR